MPAEVRAVAAAPSMRSAPLSGPSDLVAPDELVVHSWVSEFNKRLEASDFAGVSLLFEPEAYVRDLLALTWDFRTFKSRPSIEQILRDTAHTTRPRRFRLAERNVTKRKVKVDGTSVVETILDFDTEAGAGKAVLRLVEAENGDHRAWVMSTILFGLADHPEQVGAQRPVGAPSLDTFGGQNWFERRQLEQLYIDRDPEVLVVGGAQSGLGIAARLRALGVDTLVVDRLPRVGDVWRNRYHSLTLHNAVWLNHLPYMPFPDNWPVYIPKDKLANWFEAYAEAMELNVWTSTELVSATRDDATGQWTAELRNYDGSVRTLHPAHIVMATGASGIPFTPHIPGLSNFRGAVMHSAEFEGGRAIPHERAIVFGSGNSAHDVAQDLYTDGGCQVTMVQKGSTTIVDIQTVHDVYDRYSSRLSPDLADLLLVATPYELAVDAFRAMTKIAKERDKALISELNAVGFRTDYGDDETGHRMKYLRRGGGYYINVGCSNLIANKQIGLLQFDQIEEVVEDGVRLKDGSIVPADLIVLATGYQNLSALATRVFGAEAARRLGPIWGYGDDGELRSMYKRTDQPGLWFHAGSLTQSRVYSRLLALQIKACLEGILDPDVGAGD